MTRLGTWLRKQAEKWIAQRYEGPRAPGRLREQVIAFANMHPNATRGEFAAFASDFANQCYESGYLRGVEWAERDPEAFDSLLTPEEIADQMDPEWRTGPAFELERAGAVLAEKRDEAAIVREQVREANSRARRW